MHRIYGLFDPRHPDVVMQVGETMQPLGSRLYRHVNHAKRNQRLGRCLSPCQRWILRLLAKGRRPGIRLLATTTRQNWHATEVFYIRLWRKKNPRLLNVLNGGNGKDTGEVKVFCDKCGTRRKLFACGSRKCPKCKRVYERAYHRKPNRQAYLQAYRRTPKMRAWKYAYNRDRWQATKLGLTVAEYRKQKAQTT